MFTPQPSPSTGVETAVQGIPVSAAPSSPLAPSAFGPVSLFGMNLYLTGLERSESQSATLGRLAAQGGVRWSREELSWANIEPTSKGSYNWGPYDRRLASVTGNGIEPIGMLLTTPRWASTNPGAGDWYWYEPANYNDYFDFVRAAVARWKNQIDTWEIWNEPNHAQTWNCLNNCNRAANYARLLAGAYAAVKSVDPNARVLIGGLYIHDANNEGMAFLDAVVNASGGAINFDGLSIHTYMPDRIPESMRPDSVVQNFQYRLHVANNWIESHGGRPGEIWITEEGKSTCTTCPFRWSEEEQASMLARMYGIAAASPRVVHFSYFQFEDKFNNPADLYGGMSIVRDNLTVKPAYNAYATTSRMLDGAQYTGTGPQMVPGNNPHQPDTSDYVGFDYRFVKNGVPLHMVWRPNDTVTVNYPVETAQVDVVDRDGGVTRRMASGGAISLQIGPRPQYIVNVSCVSTFTDVCPDNTFYAPIECLASRGIMGGYDDGTFRPNASITRGQLSKIVSNAAGYSDTPTRQTFTDVPPGSTFYPFIERMASRGVIGGYPDGTFRPNAPATRGQIAKIVSNARGYTDTPTGQTFQDVAPGSAFYVWIERLASRGVMGGYACGSPNEPCVTGKPYFRPGANATRGQVSKIVANTFYPTCAP